MKLKLANILKPESFKLNVAKNCYQPVKSIDTIEFEVNLPSTSKEN